MCFLVYGSWLIALKRVHGRDGAWRSHRRISGEKALRFRIAETVRRTKAVGA